MRVHVHRSGVMQDMLRHISKGYVWYFRGVVHVSKVQNFIEKISALYATGLDENQRSYRKRKGLANARLFIYPRASEDAFEYVVLMTDGHHIARSAERLALVTAKRTRLIFQDRFEPIVLPATGSVPRWTWRLTHEAYEAQALAVRIAVRKRGDDSEVRRVISNIYGMPGFRGLRQQMVTLLKLLHAEWKRGRGDDSCPYVSSKPKGYLRLIDIKTIPLNDVVACVAAGQPPIPHHLVYDRSQQRGIQTDKAIYCADAGGEPAIETGHSEPRSS